MSFNPSDIYNPRIDFETMSMRVLAYQLDNNSIFREFYSNLLGHTDLRLFASEFIPLLPIEAFRDAQIYASDKPHPDLVFKSSGTSTSVRSTHNVAHAEMYRRSVFTGFQQFYAIENYVILAYTPGYNQNPNSSLIWMLNEFINAESTGLSQFLEIGKPIEDSLIDKIVSNDKCVMLFGAAFGLVELAEKYPIFLPEGSIVMETGGMKTYRKEMSRSDLHNALSDGFGIGLNQVHSEYGMTELLSQAYSTGDQWFQCPPWMRVTIRDPYNPIRILSHGEEGLIGIIDLANWESCPFILTGDRGVLDINGRFQVNGRWGDYHLRGCNFLLEAE
jgi:hypothetical protein